MTTFQFG